MMRHSYFACLLYFIPLGWCFAQSPSPKVNVSSDIQAMELTQRVIQYELILGSKIDSITAICIDEGLNKSWLLSENSNTELPAKSIERVRRRLEICSAGQGNTTQDLRFAAELRNKMEVQLKAAQTLDATSQTARSCIAYSRTPEEFKLCLTSRAGTSPSSTYWTRWLILFERLTGVWNDGTSGQK